MNDLPLSVCIIARNEEKHIKRLLDSLQGVARQIVLVDTGSTDQTKEIAKSYNAKIKDFVWCDDFSAARNESIAAADQPWILILDADEMLPPNAREVISSLIDQPHNAYNVVTKNYTRQTTCTNWMPLGPDDEYARAMGHAGWYPSYKIRLFRSGLGYSFVGRVHELIKSPSELAPFFVHHFVEDSEKDDSWHRKKNYYLELGIKKIEDSPGNAQSYFELALQYLELGLIKNAIPLFEKTNELDPDFGDDCYGNVFYELGNCYGAHLRDYDKAIEYYKRSVAKRPGHAASYYNMANVYQQKGQSDVAEKLYIETLKLNPSFALAANNLASLYIEKKRYREGIAMAQQAIRANPSLPSAYQNLAFCLYELGEKEQAINLSLETLHRFPSNEGSAYNLGRFYYTAKDFENSLKYFKQVVKTAPHRPESYNHIAAIYADLHLYHQADQTFREAIEYAGRDPMTLSNYATLRERLGDKDAARALQKEAGEPSTDAKKQKVVATLRVKNEAAIIGRNLERISLFADEIVVLDDGSTDSTVEICKSFPKVVHCETQNLPLKEDRDRNKLLQLAKARNADWIMAIDADEIFDTTIIDELPQLIQDPDADAFCFKVCTFWRGHDYHRVDGVWGPLNQIALYRNLPGQEIQSDHPQGFHCGSAPPIRRERIKQAKSLIEHYGYDSYERAKKKYDWYMNVDTKKERHLIGGEDYRHLIEERGMALQQWKTPHLNYNKKACIIIPVHLHGPSLDRCLSSIHKNTDFPYEVIIVGNNPTQDVLDVIQRYHHVPTFPMYWIHNKTNEGFPKAINAGLEYCNANSLGEYIVWLNSDVIVTPNWLSRLIRHLENAPLAGAVGPVSNYVLGSQQVPYPQEYGDLAFRIEQFAQMRKNKYPGTVVEIPYFIGFCAAMKRSLMNKLGPLDEVFGIGNSEDFDYSLRIKDVGQKLYMAQDVFIYHYGSVHFKALEKSTDYNYQKQQAENLERLRSKWSEEKIKSLHWRYEQPEYASANPVITANVVFGIAENALPVTRAKSTKKNFANITEFRAFLKDTYLQMFERVKSAAKQESKLELGIALLPPEQEDEDTANLLRYTFGTLEEGLSFVTKFTDNVQQQACN